MGTKRYIVRLDEEERSQLKNLLAKKVLAAKKRKRAEVLLKAVQEIQVALKGLRSLKNTDTISEKLISIHQLENDGDSILRAALSRLFKEEERPILVMKWKEIFERLEKATDRCEDVANLIEKIVIEAS